MDKLKKHAALVKSTAIQLIAESATTMQKEAIKNLGKGVSETAVTVIISDAGMTATVETHIVHATLREYGPSGKPFFNRAFETARQKAAMTYKL